MRERLESAPAAGYEGGQSEAPIRLALVGAWIVACIPLLFVRYLPSVDFPNHVARIFLLARGLALPGYREFYHAHWAFLPNLAFDLFAAPLARMMPVEAAARLFLFATFALVVFGGARLNKALTGRLTLLSLAPSFLTYNRVLTFGFVNYVFGVGLMLLALAVRIELRRAARWKRLLVDLVFMAALLASHLVALVLYVVFASVYEFSHEISEGRSWKKGAVESAIVLAPFAVFLAAVFALSPTADELAAVHYVVVTEKLKLLYITFLTGQMWLDSLFSTSFFLLLAWMLFKGRIRIHSTMRVPLVVLLALFLVMPSGFGQAVNVDERLPLVITILFFASLTSVQSAPRWIGLCFGALLLFRCGTMSAAYAKDQRATDQLMEDARVIPAGSEVLVVTDLKARAFYDSSWNPPYLHLSCLLLLDRPLFMGDLFAYPSQQPILRNPPYDRLDLPEDIGDGVTRNLYVYAHQARSALRAFTPRQKEAFVYFVRPPGPLPEPPELEVEIVRPRYAIYRFRDLRS